MKSPRRTADALATRATPPVALAPSSILAVDDHETNLYAIEAILAPLGHRLVRAGSGEEALRYLLEEDFAVVLLDVVMPGMDGFAVAGMMRARVRSRATPIIFLTGLAEDPTQRAKAYLQGAVDYLVKPLDPEVLRAKVRVFVELHESREEIRRQANTLREREREQEKLQGSLIAAAQAKVRAEASASTYRLLAESIPQQVWTARPDGGLDHVSSVVCRYFGLPAEEILGAGWQAVIHPEDLPGCAAKWVACLASGEDYDVEFRLRRHDGAYRWHLGRAVAERDSDGQILRWFGTNTDIHDRRLGEAALAESESRLRLALDAGRMGDWEWDIVAQKVRWSPAIERMHGIPEGSFDGRFETWQSDMHPEDRERVLSRTQESLKLGRHEIRYRIVRPDGAVRWLEAHGRVLRDEAGQPTRVVGVCADVTDRQEVEETARRFAAKEAARAAAVEAEERVRQVVESISDPMFILDGEWCFDYVNQEGAALVGRPVAELLGASVWDVFPDAIGSVFEREYRRARADGVPVAFEAHVAPLARWFEVNAYPTRDGRLSVQYRDISARKQEQARVVREGRHAAMRAEVSSALSHGDSLAQMLEKCTHALVQHLGVAFARIWTLDSESRVLELQASSGLYTHLDGAHARVPVGKFKIGRIAQRRTPHLTNDVAHDPEVGDPAWAKANGMVAFAGYPLVVDQRCTGVVAMFAREPIPADTLNAIAAVADAIAQGIERARAEEELKERARELARSNAELEQFAYVASHDLQEPLRMVASYTQLLGRRYKGKLDASADEFIGFAVDGASRMQALINDLLAFSRVGTRAAPRTRTSLAVPIAQARANLKVALAESGATLTVDPMPELPIDVSQLGQLFQNLIGNALKFRGEGPPAIHVGAREEDGRWTFSVADNGIGIAEEFFGRLFVLFQRLHTRTEYPGNGIGLAICKKIVERHGGRIWVESQPGQGTTFHFTLANEDHE